MKMLFPPCRLNSKSRAMLWKQDKKWSWWMTCLQLEVREAGAGGVGGGHSGFLHGGTLRTSCMETTTM